MGCRPHPTVVHLHPARPAGVVRPQPHPSRAALTSFNEVAPDVIRRTARSPQLVDESERAGPIHSALPAGRPARGFAVSPTERSGRCPAPHSAASAAPVRDRVGPVCLTGGGGTGAGRRVRPSGAVGPGQRRRDRVGAPALPARPGRDAWRQQLGRQQVQPVDVPAGGALPIRLRPTCLGPQGARRLRFSDRQSVVYAACGPVWRCRSWRRVCMSMRIFS